MSNYYTPTIEEFYVGFEYETLSWITKAWIKKVLNECNDLVLLNDTLHKRVDGQLRVKYLDQQDIEELGWVEKEDRGMSENYGHLFTKKSDTYSQAFYEIQFWNNTRRLRINYFGIGCQFDGIVKNKTEFQKVLQQINK